MPDVVLPYPLIDGEIFLPDEYNQCLYEVPDNMLPGSLSLYETSNGAISFDNLNTGFKVRSHMIRPWQVGNAQSEGMVKPLDFFANAWSKNRVLYGVAGAGLTFYQPYDVSLGLFFSTIFASIWRQRGPETTTSGVWEAPPEMFVRMQMDGVALVHTTRTFPQTIYFSETKTFGGQYDFSFAREERLTRYFQLHHAKMTNGTAGKRTDQLLKGWHSFGMTVYVAQNAGTEEVDRDGAPLTGDLFPDARWRNMPRVRMYVRHADMLTIL